MNREQFLRMIPKPKNQEVVVYDINLKDLLDVNVFAEYEKDYSDYVEKKQKYDLLKEERNQYLETINKAYLYNTSWGESDYINMIQLDKKTYATMYSDIKKIEDKINVSEKKLKVLEEKLNLQKIKDKKEVDKQLKDVDDKIEKNKNLYFQIKDKLNDLYNDIKYIDDRIDDTNKDKELILKMKDDLNNDVFICEYCGTKIKSHSSNSHIAKRIERNLTENNKQLDSLNKRKEKTELEIAFLENKFKNVKQELNNSIEVKKQGDNIYIKKSIEVLKLEGLRTKTTNDIALLKKSLEKQPHYNSDKFKEIKERLSLYELSLDNLHKIKIAKINMQEKSDEFNTLEKEVSNIENRLKKYINFIRIYYKICEQKLNIFFGNNITFKLYEIEDYEVKDVLKIYCNKISYEYLDTKTKEKVDKILIKNLYENI